jgi:hypothetical protein
MDKSRFSIFEAIQKAYVFVGRERSSLLMYGAAAMALQTVTDLFVQFQRPESSLVEGYLWELPATFLLARFMFLETRLLLLGERPEQLPQDQAYLSSRQRGLAASVISAVLFNMAMMAARVLLLALQESGQWGTNRLVTMAGFLVIGVLIWGVRFGIAPVLLAVNYPFRPVLRKTAGPMFSLRLIALGILCVLPVSFLFQTALALAVSGSGAKTLGDLAPAVQAGIIAGNAVFSLVSAALLTAAVAYALKQILRSR